VNEFVPSHDLVRFGFPSFSADFEPLLRRGLSPGRVVAEHRGAYVLITPRGERAAHATGRLLHDARDRLALPAVGDWVAIDDDDRIHAVLPRRTVFVRGVAGGVTEPQVVAANVDVVTIVTAFGGDLNARRIERALTLVRAGGAEPVVVASKYDLATDADERALATIRALGAPLHVVSVPASLWLEALRARFVEGRTFAFVGSSGVGKSTLVNALAGAEQRTLDLGVDGRGRHTTTHRQLFALPGGGIVLDTPGMRELRLSASDDDVLDEAIDASFADIAGLAEHCRFRDCSHGGEPGCAVVAALDDGKLDAERWASFDKLRRETRAFEARKDVRAAMETRRRIKTMARAARVRDRQRRKSR